MAIVRSSVLAGLNHSCGIRSYTSDRIDRTRETRPMRRCSAGLFAEPRMTDAMVRVSFYYSPRYYRPRSLSLSLVGSSLLRQRHAASMCAARTIPRETCGEGLQNVSCVRSLPNGRRRDMFYTTPR